MTGLALMHRLCYFCCPLWITYKKTQSFRFLFCVGIWTNLNCDLLIKPHIYFALGDITAWSQLKAELRVKRSVATTELQL